ncbi:hypothetical protein BgiBS90_000478 [Biomphalaria glabrata]|nr:hypothetical protein BgiBS90_000478 [Biomphalaria glabrata]
MPERDFPIFKISGASSYGNDRSCELEKAERFSPEIETNKMVVWTCSLTKTKLHQNKQFEPILELCPSFQRRNASANPSIECQEYRGKNQSSHPFPLGVHELYDSKTSRNASCLVASCLGISDYFPSIKIEQHKKSVCYEKQNMFSSSLGSLKEFKINHLVT